MHIFYVYWFAIVYAWRHLVLYADDDFGFGHAYEIWSHLRDIYLMPLDSSILVHLTLFALVVMHINSIPLM